VLVADTLVPVWVNAVFHALLIVSSPGNVKVSVQPLMLVVPLLPMVTLAVKSPGQLVGV
jgi:hypothetical protein